VGSESALKVMRYSGGEAGAWAADFVREVSIWASIKPHVNVVEFLGVGSVGEGDLLQYQRRWLQDLDLYHVIHDALSCFWSIWFASAAALEHRFQVAFPTKTESVNDYEMYNWFVQGGCRHRSRT